MKVIVYDFINPCERVMRNAGRLEEALRMRGFKKCRKRLANIFRRDEQVIAPYGMSSDFKQKLANNCECGEIQIKDICLDISEIGQVMVLFTPDGRISIYEKHSTRQSVKATAI